VGEVPAGEGERAGRRDRLGRREVRRPVACLERDPGLAANVVHHRLSVLEISYAEKREWYSRVLSRDQSALIPEPGVPRSSGGVHVALDDGVAVMTIDRPEARNAIGFATISELDAALDRVLSSGVAVLVLRGGGDRAFVSGGDLKELSAIRTHEDAVGMASRVPRLRDRVAAFPVPAAAPLNAHPLPGRAQAPLPPHVPIP